MKLLTDFLTLDRPLVGLDLETTGVNAKEDGIVEVGLEIFVPGQPIQEYRTLVNPMMPIPPGATEKHGIVNADVADAPTFVQLAANLALSLTDVDFVGYHVRFDLEFLEEEFNRGAKFWSYAGARIIDSHRLWQLAEGRTLSDAIEYWLGPQEARDGERIDGQAHRAMFDVKMASRVAAAQLEKRPDIFPRDLDALHQLQWPDWFDVHGKLRWRNGELVLTFGVHRDRPLSQVPFSYLTKFIGGPTSTFSELVKSTCRNAARGIFPTCPTPSTK